MGLVNRVVPVGQARVEAESLARQLAGLPQTCLAHDRLSVLESEGLSEEQALEVEHEHGLVSLTEAVEGAQRFVAVMSRSSCASTGVATAGGAAGSAWTWDASPMETTAPSTSPLTTSSARSTALGGVGRARRSWAGLDMSGSTTPDGEGHAPAGCERSHSATRERDA